MLAQSPQVINNKQCVLQVFSNHTNASTSFQDTSRGQIPATYGSNLVTNGTFDTDLTGWVPVTNGYGTVTWVSGAMEIAKTVNEGWVKAYQSVTLEAGEWFELTVPCITEKKENVFAKVGVDVPISSFYVNAENQITLFPGTVTHIFQALSNNVYLIFEIGTETGSSITLDDIKLRKVLTWQNKIITAHGNVKHSTAHPKFTSSSIYFDGAGDYLSVSDSNDFWFSIFDFIISVWIYITSLPIFPDNADLIEQQWNTDIYSFGTLVRLQNDGKIRTAIRDSSDNIIGDITSTNTLSTGQWYHILYSRVDVNFYQFIDAVLSGTASGINAHANYSKPFLIGCQEPGTFHFHGYMQDINIIRGKGVKNFNLPVRMT